MAPMLIGVVPFGLIAGTTPAAIGLDVSAALGFSLIVFAGASQLAAIEVASPKRGEATTRVWRAWLDAM